MKAWSLAMYERLLRLDGQLLADIDEADRCVALDTLARALPNVAAAERALQRFEANRRRPWTTAGDENLRKLYPDRKATEVARLLGRTLRAVYARAKQLGLHKSEEFQRELLEEEGRRLRVAGVASRFRPGHQLSPNRGVKGWDSGGRSHETRFKKGQHPPIGTERLSKDGYLQRKVTDTGYPPRDWKGVHVLLWEEHHGPVQAGHAVVFKDGDKKHIAIENLELITRAELMARNTIHRYPGELKDAIRLTAKLRRTIRRVEEERQQA